MFRPEVSGQGPALGRAVEEARQSRWPRAVDRIKRTRALGAQKHGDVALPRWAGQAWKAGLGETVGRGKEPGRGGVQYAGPRCRVESVWPPCRLPSLSAGGRWGGPGCLGRRAGLPSCPGTPEPTPVAPAVPEQSVRSRPYPCTASAFLLRDSH